ncbi:MAG: hypothetical protein ACRC5H_09495, partial [Treponemataceae bacterium]
DERFLPSNARYKVMRDLDFNNRIISPVPSANGDSVLSSHGFAGTFDGNGYEFKNMKIENLRTDEGKGTGLFAQLANHGVLKNIILSDSVTVHGDTKNVGGLVGFVVGGTITNIVSQAEVKSSNDTNEGINSTGGIIGQVLPATGTFLKLEKLENYKNVTAIGGNIGGVIGFYNAAVSLKDLYNEGTISSNAIAQTGVARVGGIIGNMTFTKGITLTNIVNAGSFSDFSAFSDSNGTAALLRVGGLVGYMFAESNVSFKNFYNLSRITLTSEQKAIKHGGLVGSVEGGNTFNSIFISFDTGFNIGEIPVTKEGFSNGVILHVELGKNIKFDFFNIFIARSNPINVLLLTGASIPDGGIAYHDRVTDFSENTEHIQYWDSNNQFVANLPAGFDTKIWAIGTNRKSLQGGLKPRNTKRPVIIGLGEGKNL